MAAIYYEKAHTSAVPTTNTTVPDAELKNCANDPLASTVPSYRITSPSKPQTEQIVNITLQSNGTHSLFYMNNSTFRADYNDPVRFPRSPHVRAMLSAVSYRFCSMPSWARRRFPLSTTSTTLVSILFAVESVTQALTDRPNSIGYQLFHPPDHLQLRRGWRPPGKPFVATFIHPEPSLTLVLPFADAPARPQHVHPRLRHRHLGREIHRQPEQPPAPRRAAPARDVGDRSWVYRRSVRYR